MSAPSVGGICANGRANCLSQTKLLNSQDDTLFESIDFIVRLFRSIRRKDIESGSKMHGKPPPADKATTCALRGPDGCRQGVSEEARKGKETPAEPLGCFREALSRPQQAQSHVVHIIFRTAD
jgi:hypothetical protein